MGRVFISHSFDNIQLQQVRLLEEASQHGPVTVLLWSDETVEDLTGKRPQFPLEEREYTVSSIRYVDEVQILHDRINPDILPVDIKNEDVWVVSKEQDCSVKKAFCELRGITYHTFSSQQLTTLPDMNDGLAAGSSDRKKVIVTGCFDWFHSGHIRFFEEVSELGDLYVVVGNDANVQTLKGRGHPMFPQQQRRYMVQAIRFVTQALISTGSGWIDAEPEIARIQPNIYAVNEDGDKPIKQQFCQEHGIEYVIFKRLPRPGLPRRESTHLRGF
ncbi:MAG: adenylyltransferase/cytidyltransferase family protein [Sedimentisphaerales bacterium]|nr:adenylyltransferase/cytidyltransferase family protein [Sedimentisphaerales bacterium]